MSEHVTAAISRLDSIRTLKNLRSFAKFTAKCFFYDNQ